MSGPTAAATLEIERPGRGRPHQQVGADEVGVALGVVDEREADVHRRIDDVAVDVGLAQLVGRQRGAAASAVGADLVALVEQSLLPELGDQPPHRLDVVVRQRPVGIGRVDPGARAGGEGRPVLDVAQHRVAAVLVELGHPVGLDLVLGVEAELLFDLELDGQAVAVPAALAGYGVAPHGLEPRVEVLEHPGPHVVEARAAVGGGWTLVEDPRLAVLRRWRWDSASMSCSRQRSSTRSSRATRSKSGSMGPKGIISAYAARSKAQIPFGAGRLLDCPGRRA